MDANAPKLVLIRDGEGCGDKRMTTSGSSWFYEEQHVTLVFQSSAAKVRLSLSLPWSLVGVQVWRLFPPGCCPSPWHTTASCH